VTSVVSRFIRLLLKNNLSAENALSVISALIILK